MRGGRGGESMEWALCGTATTSYGGTKAGKYLYGWPSDYVSSLLSIALNCMYEEIQGWVTVAWEIYGSCKVHHPE